MQFALDYISQRAGKQTSDQRLDIFPKYICDIHHNGWGSRKNLLAKTTDIAVLGLWQIPSYLNTVASVKTRTHSARWLMQPGIYQCQT